MAAPELRLGVSSNEASALLQVDGDNTRGALPYPRMTTTERDAISSPATGLTVFNTTTATIDYYDGAGWRQTSAGSAPSAAVTTTNATFTTAVTTPTASNISYSISAVVTGRRTGGSSGSTGDSAGYRLFAAFKNISGTVTQIGATDKVALEDQAGWDADFTISGTNILTQVKGATNNNVSWEAVVQVVSI